VKFIAEIWQSDMTCCGIIITSTSRYCDQSCLLICWFVC